MSLLNHLGQLFVAEDKALTLKLLLNFFVNCFLIEKILAISERNRAILRTPSWFTYRDTSKRGCIDPERLKVKGWPEAHVRSGCDHRKSICVLVDVSRRAERNVTLHPSPSLFLTIVHHCHILSLIKWLEIPAENESYHAAFWLKCMENGPNAMKSRISFLSWQHCDYAVGSMGWTWRKWVSLSVNRKLMSVFEISSLKKRFLLVI